MSWASHFPFLFAGMKKILRGLALPAAGLLFWLIGSHYNLFNSYIVPAPQKVLAAFIKITASGYLLDGIFISLARVLCGFVIAALLACILALLLYIFPAFQAYMRPSLDFIRHIPPLAIISLLILWFGIGETPKIVVVALASFFPIFLNLCNGIEQCDQKLIEVGRAARMNEWNLFARIIFPSLIPSIMVGLQLGLSYGWRSLVGAELIAASSGLGYMIMEARELAKSDVIIIGVLVLGIIGGIIDGIFLYFTRSVLTYHKEA